MSVGGGPGGGFVSGRCQAAGIFLSRVSRGRGAPLGDEGGTRGYLGPERCRRCYLRGATGERSKSAICGYVLINNSNTRQGAVPPSLAWTDTSDGDGTGSQTSPNAEHARVAWGGTAAPT